MVSFAEITIPIHHFVCLFLFSDCLSPCPLKILMKPLQTKGTQSFGKKNNHSHTYNRHTGKTNLHKHKLDFDKKKKTCKQLLANFLLPIVAFSRGLFPPNLASNLMILYKLFLYNPILGDSSLLFLNSFWLEWDNSGQGSQRGIRGI